jgi:isopenicillin N synthase-like dioxygenase
VLNQSQKFFALPHSTKMLAPHPPGGSHHRGYSAPGLEKVSQNIYDESELAALRASMPDVKETFESGNIHDKNQPNIWLPEDALPGFRAFMESFFLECAGMVKALLGALELALGLDEHGINLPETHSDALFQLRLLHYPPIPLQRLVEKTHTRISAHSDFGTLTLLFQDKVGGLEIESQSQPGEFNEVVPEEWDTVLVNVGDLMMRWSNDRWRSAVHRVGAPEAMIKKATDGGSGVLAQNGDGPVVPSRYSIPLFATANDEAVIDAFPGTWGEGLGEKKYEPMTAREYVQMRMAALYN